MRTTHIWQEHHVDDMERNHVTVQARSTMGKNNTIQRKLAKFGAESVGDLPKSKRQQKKSMAKKERLAIKRVKE